jgi:hypothetical protein
LSSWGKWFNTGAVVIYPYITEFIARYKICKNKDESKEDKTFAKKKII